MPSPSRQHERPSEGDNTPDDLWKEPLYAPVLWDFVAESDREITLSAGQMVIVWKQDAEWTFVQNQITGETGYVPNSYLELIL